MELEIAVSFMTARMPPGNRPGHRRRPAHDRLQAIVEQMPDGVLIAAVDGTIRFANPAAETLFGRPITFLAGEELGFPSVVGDSTEIEIVRPGGATVNVELRVVETEWDGERVRLVSLRDVTDRKRADERAAQLERERIARAEAEASSQAKSEFLATMSHELRTPLNAVIGYSELLDLGIAGSMTADQRKQVSRIRDSARHLLGLVNEVLDLAKVEAGRLAVHTRAEPATGAINAAIALAQPIADARGITLLDRCTNAELVYEGDEDRVRQIMLNLVNNAIKFTPAGGSVTVECGMSSRPEAARVTGKGPWICFRVSDTGMGIPQDRIASIFDPFVQVERGHTRSSDGSGLGLTISRRLARLMGGDLTVQSEPGKGSTFTLWLPEATAAQREAARWRAEAPDTAARLEGLGQVGDALLQELPTLVDAFVDRIRAENLVPGVQSLRSTQVADHIASYVADLASILAAIEEARGQPSRLIADGSDLQLRIAEKHGGQRARLGWTAKALHREWSILKEEMARVIRRATNVPKPAADEAQVVLDRFVEQGEQESFRSFNRTLAEAASAAHLFRRAKMEADNESHSRLTRGADAAPSESAGEQNEAT